eukprot:239441-Chlamydomonas_euryale.AAC.6
MNTVGRPALRYESGLARHRSSLSASRRWAAAPIRSWVQPCTLPRGSGLHSVQVSQMIRAHARSCCPTPHPNWTIPPPTN